MTLIRAAVITLSDKGFAGQREDQSGKKVIEILQNINAVVEHYEILPDEFETIRNKLIDLCERNFDLIITTGGTGVSPRDVTPDATLSVVEKRLYGIEMAMMNESLKYTPFGMLSRAVAGVKGRTLIINLPGSPKAVQENLNVILPAIPHAIEKIKGSTIDCAKQENGEKS
ncbi:MogA/MoaB family molybdenum cofactor biosynthesis protein [Thermotoga profunda]|uniref:MogA/MoaB family molybdenum cofactor biosynthesis protein n=1 Tax=Thermotoga profunda TaxID=1508420 RepID=UPI0006934171|nr:MogA/MoaB family molybdenum cofactor biosynthesis protein [Thermotoga profunda]